MPGHGPEKTCEITELDKVLTNQGQRGLSTEP